MTPSTAEASIPASPRPSAGANKYLIFRLGGEEHGVPLLSVREVSSHRSARPVPNAPRHIVGVTNLRGTVISVVSLERLLRVVDASSDECRVMLVIDLGESTLAVLVDEVVAVRAIEDNEIDRSPHTELSEVANHLRGIAHLDDRLVTLLDLNSLLAGEVMPRASRG
jgi:purine-binding chemotaxis protein CheW